MRAEAFFVVAIVLPRCVLEAIKLGEFKFDEFGVLDVYAASAGPACYSRAVFENF